MYCWKKSAKVEPREMVSIRMEAIGGQGANSAGKILAEAAVLGMHFTGNHFSSFGSEKRGSPVRSFVRFSPSRKPVRGASFIKNPNLLVIFHEALIRTHPEILEGVDETTDLLINSSRKPGEIELPRGIKARNVISVDASKIATKEQCGLNAAILGACASVIPEVDSSVVLEALKRFFSRLPEKILKHNVSGFQAAAKATVMAQFKGEQAGLEAPHGALPRLGWLNAPIGGVIANGGNTALRDNSVSRKGVIPRLDLSSCISCGYCDMVCPDYCFVWDKDPNGENPPNMKGIDYQYCKGCQKCISVCPVDALTPVLETDLPQEEKTVRNFPDLTREKIEAHWQGMNWELVVEAIPPDARMLMIQTELLNPKSYIKPDFKNSKEDK